MKKVLLSCMALAAGAAMAIAQNDPVYPSELDFTLNGEKELSGVSVSQTMGKESLLIEIKGKSDADAIKMDFVLPDDWDYALIGSVIGGEDNPFMTRSSHWLPVSLATQQGYKKGSSFSFPVDGKESYGTIYLVKGDNVWEYPIDIEFRVSKTGGSDEPVVGDDPAFPTNIGVTTYAEGLVYSQGIEYDVLTISLTGKISERTFDVVFEVPEGWDGFISTPYEDNIEIGESGITPGKTRSVESHWMSVEKFIEYSESSFMPITPIKGNKFTFMPNGEEQDVAVYLYKDNMVYLGDYISLETSVIVDNDPTGISSVNAADKATYYDLNGNKMSNPKTGMNIKVVEGKATKFIEK